MGFPGISVGKESAYNAGDPGWIPGSGKSPGEGIGYPLQYSWASLQLGRNLPAMRETWVWSLGWDLSRGEGKDYRLQYSGLENSMDCIVHGVAKELDPAEWLSLPVISSKVFNRIEETVYPSYICSLNVKAFSVSSLSIIFPVDFCITLSQWVNSLVFFCCFHLWSFFQLWTSLNFLNISYKTI